MVLFCFIALSPSSDAVQCFSHEVYVAAAQCVNAAKLACSMPAAGTSSDAKTSVITKQSGSCRAALVLPHGQVCNASGFDTIMNHCCHGTAFSLDYPWGPGGSWNLLQGPDFKIPPVMVLLDPTSPGYALYSWWDLELITE